MKGEGPADAAVGAEKAVPTMSPGDKFGDSTVRRLIGSGSMGSVYLVTSPDGEEYALKVMSPALMAKNPGYRRRFVKEAAFAMSIHHRNLITVHDAGEDPERGFCYILMDYMAGGSLAGMLARRGALPINEAVSIASQVAFALDAAHSRGVIHRDIKPANILFGADGVPKLADLGVAKFESDATATMVTEAGMIVGTPAYMAPEQMMDSHSIDARADVYSLGVVLYEMLTNTRPNGGSTVMGLIAKAIRGEPLPDVRTMRPEVSAAVAYVLSLMCAPRPEDRPKTSGAAGDLLVRADSDSLLMDSADGAAPGAEKDAGKSSGRRGWWSRLGLFGKASR
ncbi:MAG: serine/threonine protein kinase [Kiritimatiellae bacterium]|nr:serine/threonine protein kinase [Kiritimatiellia bacterium]